MKLEKKLKKNIVEKYLKFGDNKCMVYGGVSYTGSQVANEIELETETGMKILNGILNLAIELVSRQKEKIN